MKPVPGSLAYAKAVVDEENNGALAAASAAPRASAVCGSSGALTIRVVAASSAGLIEVTSTSEPTTNKPPGRPPSVSARAASDANSAVRSPPCNACRCTSEIEPSAESTTANVAVSGSTNNNAVLS